MSEARTKSLSNRVITYTRQRGAEPNDWTEDYDNLTPRQRRRANHKAERASKLEREELAEIAALNDARELDGLLDELAEYGPTLDELTRDELRRMAKEANIPGRGSMTKAELIVAIEEL